MKGEHYSQGNCFITLSTGSIKSVGQKIHFYLCISNVDLT